MTGLDTHQLISGLRQEENRKKARVIFTGKVKEVTAAAVRDLLHFKYSEGSERDRQMATGQGFLMFLQATKGNIQLIHSLHAFAFLQNYD